MFSTVFISSFVLVFLAELGDKSQLMCMLLASRHKPWPVFIGAVLAFLTLNLLAVTIGAGLAEVIPEDALVILAIGLFGFFGVKTLLDADDEDTEIKHSSGRSVITTAFTMVFLAELGDKTQLSVAALAAAEGPFAVYFGASLALLCTTALGVAGGRYAGQFVAPNVLKKIAGSLFLLFAIGLGLHHFA